MTRFGVGCFGGHLGKLEGVGRRGYRAYRGCLLGKSVFGHEDAFSHHKVEVENARCLAQRVFLHQLKEAFHNAG